MARTPALSPGDRVSWGMKVPVSLPNGNVIHIELTATTKVRKGENGPRAVRRIAHFVESTLDRKVQDALQQAGEGDQLGSQAES